MISPSTVNQHQFKYFDKTASGLKDEPCTPTTIKEQKEFDTSGHGLRSSVFQLSAGASNDASLDRSTHLRVTNARLAKLEKMYDELSMLEARARTQEDTTAKSTNSQIREKSGNKDDKYCPK